MGVHRTHPAVVEFPAGNPNQGGAAEFHTGSRGEVQSSLARIGACQRLSLKRLSKRRAMRGGVRGALCRPPRNRGSASPGRPTPRQKISICFGVPPPSQLIIPFKKEGRLPNRRGIPLPQGLLAGGMGGRDEEQLEPFDMGPPTFGKATRFGWLTTRNPGEAAQRVLCVGDQRKSRSAINESRGRGVGFVLRG